MANKNGDRVIDQQGNPQKGDPQYVAPWRRMMTKIAIELAVGSAAIGGLLYGIHNLAMRTPDGQTPKLSGTEKIRIDPIPAPEKMYSVPSIEEVQAAARQQHPASVPPSGQMSKKIKPH